MRTLVDIPDEIIDQLDALARERNRSRAAEVREALRAHLARRQPKDNSWVYEYAGYWKDRPDIPDGVEYQRALREDQDLGFEWPPRSSTPTS